MLAYLDSQLPLSSTSRSGGADQSNICRHSVALVQVHRSNDEKKTSIEAKNRHLSSYQWYVSGFNYNLCHHVCQYICVSP